MTLKGKIKAALIDMDGVLYDSMPGHARAWKNLFDETGIPCSYDEFFLYEGMTGKDTINHIFMRQFNRHVSDDEAASLYAKKACFFEAQGEKKVMPGAEKMLVSLKNAGIRCILVTGSGQKSILDRIDKDFPGIFAAGDRITALDVVHGKPDPEPYLKGLEKAGCNKDEAIVIENAPLGVRAGVAAGIFTVAVTTGPIPRKAFENENASVIFTSMPQFADRIDILLNNKS